MNTYREIAYLCLDLVKELSDDSYYTVDHIIYLMDKYRAMVLKKTYANKNIEIPESNFQTISVTTTKGTGEKRIVGAQHYLVSSTTIPNIIDIATPRVESEDYYQGDITYVLPERFKFVGNNNWLLNIVYATIGSSKKLYLKSKSFNSDITGKELYLSAIFEESFSISNLDSTFPLEDSLVPQVIELIVKDLLGAAYRPMDNQNNATDNLSDLMAFIRRSLKSPITKAIED